MSFIGLRWPLLYVLFKNLPKNDNVRKCHNNTNKCFAAIGTEMVNQIPIQKGFEIYLEKAKAKFKLREIDEEDILNITKAQQLKTHQTACWDREKGGTEIG